MLITTENLSVADNLKEALALEGLVLISVLIDKEVLFLAKVVLVCTRPLLPLTRSGKFAEPL